MPSAFSKTQVGRVRDILAHLSGACRAQTFYPVGHPAVRESAAGLMRALAPFHAEGADVPLTFFENEVLFGQQVLLEESMLFDQMVRDMSASGANSVTFTRGLTVAELERALPLLAADSHLIEAAGGVEKAAHAANIPHVIIASVKAVEREERALDVDFDTTAAAKEAYSGALDLLRELDRAVRSDRAISTERVRGVVHGLVDSVVTNRYALLELAGLKDYDEYTFFHSVNVAILSLALGSTLTTDARFLNSLGVGSLLHDIGKMGVDTSILNKPGTLTVAEWESVRLHPLHGAEVASVMPGLDRASIVIILEHHMRYDLDGYPRRRPRRRQNISSRVVAIADAYDAMTSKRSYSVARLQNEAMEVLAKNAGTAFDATLVRGFVQMLGVYPPRSVVRLSTGEVGVVVRPSVLDVLAPTVRVFADASGALVAPRDIDLSEGAGDARVTAEGAGDARVTVAACIDPVGLNVDVGDYL